jgi:hypothetical protein
MIRRLTHFPKLSQTVQPGSQTAWKLLAFRQVLVRTRDDQLSEQTIGASVEFDKKAISW